MDSHEALRRLIAHVDQDGDDVVDWTSWDPYGPHGGHAVVPGVNHWTYASPAYNPPAAIPMVAVKQPTTPIETPTASSTLADCPYKPGSSEWRRWQAALVHEQARSTTREAYEARLARERAVDAERKAFAANLDQSEVADACRRNGIDVDELTRRQETMREAMEATAECSNYAVQALNDPRRVWRDQLARVQHILAHGDVDPWPGAGANVLGISHLVDVDHDNGMWTFELPGGQRVVIPDWIVAKHLAYLPEQLRDALQHVIDAYRDLGAALEEAASDRPAHRPHWRRAPRRDDAYRQQPAGRGRTVVDGRARLRGMVRSNRRR